MLTKILAAIVAQIITFGLICLAVLFFALQFAFEWSFLLCVCVWIALLILRLVLVK